MYIRIFILTIFLLGYKLLAAQFTDETILIFGDNYLTESHNTITTSDGGLLTLGSQSNFPDASNVGDQWILKLDAQNDIEWEFKKSYADLDEFDVAYDAVELSDGYVVLGIHDTPDGELSNLIKFDFNGNMLWDLVLDDNNYSVYGAILLMDNDEFVIGGYRSGQQNIIKFSSDGNEIWNKTYLSEGELWNLYIFSDITRTSDGGILFAGQSNNTSSVLKTNSAGDLLWSKDLGTTGGARNIAVYSDETIGVFTTMTHIASPGQDYIYHLDASGNMLHEQSLDIEGIDELISATLDRENDELYIIALHFDSRDGFIFKSNKFGEVLWTRTLDASSTIDGIHPFGVMSSSDGRMIVTGAGLREFEQTDSYWTYSFYIAIFSVDGKWVSTYSAPQAVSTFEVYPNPVSEIIHFKSNIEMQESYRIQLINSYGHKVLENNVTTNLFSLNRINLSAGIYFYEILSEDASLIDKGKIILK